MPKYGILLLLSGNSSCNPFSKNVIAMVNCANGPPVKRCKYRLGLLCAWETYRFSGTNREYAVILCMEKSNYIVIMCASCVE